MAWAFVQAAKGANSSSPGSLSLTGVGAGNLLVVVICCDHAHPATAPTGAGTFTQAGTTGVDTANGQEASIWYSPNSAGGNLTVTLNPATLAATSAVFMEFSGVATTTPLDVAATPVAGATSGATPTTNALTAAAANELLIAAFNDTSGNNSTITAGTGFTINTNANEAGVAGTGSTTVEYGNSASGSNTGKFNNTNTTDKWVGLLAAFKLAGGGTKTLTLAGSNGVASVSAAVVRNTRNVPAATSVGAATVSASIVRNPHRIAPSTSTGVATVSALVGRKRTLVLARPAGAAAVSAAVARNTRNLPVSSTAGAASVSATVRRNPRNIPTPTSTGVAAVSVTLVRHPRALTAAVSGVASVSASVTRAGTTKSLAGTSAGTATVSATVIRSTRHVPVATMVGVASVSTTVTSFNRIHPAIAGSATVSATIINNPKAVFASSSGFATMTVTLTGGKITQSDSGIMPTVFFLLMDNRPEVYVRSH